jgi:DNA-binding LacI/PurR family transcriptional regulator
LVRLCSHRDIEDKDAYASFLQSIDNPDVIGLIVPFLRDREYGKIRKANSRVLIVETFPLELAPPSDVIHVTMDMFRLGELGAHALHAAGRGRILVIGKDPLPFLGAQNYVEEHDLPVQLARWRQDLQAPCDALIDRLLSSEPFDGLIATDDFLCRRILDEYRFRTGREAARDFLVATHCNRNSVLLPESELVRIECDGYRLGATCVDTILKCVQCGLLADCDIRIRPMLRMP